MNKFGARAARDLWWFFLLVIIGNGALSVANLVRSNSNEAMVSHTFQVLARLNGLMSALTYAETSVRGFVITGDPVYLQPTVLAPALVERRITQLHELVHDDPEQLEHLAAVERDVHKKFEIMNRQVEHRWAQGFPAESDLADMQDAKRVMDDARDRINGMIDNENALLEERIATAQRGLSTSVFTTVLANIVTLSVLAMLFYFMLRERKAKALLEERVRERTGELRQVVATLHDEANERELATEQLRLMTTELSRSNNDLEQFAYVASHDLQEPLRKIQAFGDRLRTRYRAQVDSQGQEYIDRMLSAAARMRKLIDDLLAFSRVTTKAQPFVAVNLNEIANDVLADLEERIEQSGAHIEIEPLPAIEADPVQIRQLLQNLLVNAMKFRKPEGRPEITIRGFRLPNDPDRAADDPGAPVVRIEVVDNGIGFDPAYQKRIFDVFQRLHGRGEYEGTGIGLALCRKIAERHGGTITARSLPGAGATFTVILPEAHSPSPNVEPSCDPLPS